jgi:Asp-tRNA(Asn)/Glu-tRNA(Gln) amidotransferase A subunit family amidase
MTRSVADAALLMQVLAQPDARDTMSLPPAQIDWSALRREVKGLRIGLLLDAGWGLAVEPDTLEAVQAAARTFEAAGATVEPLRPFTTRAMIAGLDNFWRMRSWLDFSALPPQRQAKVLPYIRDWISTAAGLSGADVFHGFSQMGAIRDATLAATQPFDFVLSPVSPVPAFTAEWASPIDDPRRPFEHIAFTLPFNMSEQPAASISCGFTRDGLPIGLQISGRRFDDLGVLQLAHAYEDLRGPQRPWPTPPG